MNKSILDITKKSTFDMPATDSDCLISVVVCTYNRSPLLKKCLESLIDQAPADGGHEVIIVDNASTDDTGTVVDEFLNNEGFRSVYESQQGLSQARNRGWREARGQYVAYIDDDATAYPDWLCEMARFIRTMPEVAVFGGPYEAYYLHPMPDWFPPDYGGFDLGGKTRQITIGTEWIYGTNMVIKRDMFLTYGGFDVRLGMNGGTTSYGEEVNFLLAMCAKDVHVYYVPTVKVRHLVAHYKMSLRWLLLSGYSIGRNYELTFNVEKSLQSHLLSLAASFVHALTGLFRKPAEQPIKRRVYTSFYRLFHEAGAVTEHVTRFISGSR